MKILHVITDLNQGGAQKILFKLLNEKIITTLILCIFKISWTL